MISEKYAQMVQSRLPKNGSRTFLSRNAYFIKCRRSEKTDKNAFDILRATLPVGTLSGAPKIRAIEIIDELEPSTRGIYGGAVGYISWIGEMDTAIAIRTGIIKDKILYVQAGCGIVADSQPESEWEETVNKGKAVFQAAELVLNNLKLSLQRK